MNEGSWSLREEVGAWITHWYLFVLAFLIGAGVGWGVAFVFPTDYEARAPLFVAFNSDALFTSPDDYKNAQFEEVTDLILSDTMVDEVLAQIGETGWDREDLRARLSVQWRNAGRWDLVVRDRDPARAARFAALWREIAFEQLTGFITHAQTFSQLDLDVNLVARKLSEATQAQTRLGAIETGVRAWLAAPDSDPVSAPERAELWAYAQEIATPRAFPAEGAERQAYLAWADDLLAVLAVKRGLLDAEIQAEQAQMDTLSAAWQAEKMASRGLSAYLVVELRGEITGGAVRAPGLLALVGGMVGGLAWISFRVARVGRRRGDDV